MNRAAAVGILAQHHARCAALEDLGGVPHRRRIETLHDRQSGKYRGVARSSRDDHVRAVLQRFDVGLDAAHADDMRAAIDDRLVQFRRIGERLDPAFPQLALEVALVLLAVNGGELEAQPFLARDPDQSLELGIVAARARRADEHRYSCRPPCEQHQPQVALERGIREQALARSQVVGARVRRSRVGSDEIGLERHRALERVLSKTGAQDSCRRQCPDFIHTALHAR